MKSVALFAALMAAVSVALGLTINTPGSVIECQPTQFSWSGGTGPYYLSLVPAGQTSASPLKTFPTQNGNSYTWNVDLAAGTSFTTVLKDGSGAQAFSDIVSIQGGTDTSCVNTSVQEGSSASGGSAATSGSGGTGATTGASGSATSAAASSSSTSSSSTPNGAGRLTVSTFGVAGLMGLVGAALF